MLILLLPVSLRLRLAILLLLLLLLLLLRGKLLMLLPTDVLAVGHWRGSHILPHGPSLLWPPSHAWLHRPNLAHLPHLQLPCKALLRVLLRVRCVCVGKGRLLHRASSHLGTRIRTIRPAAAGTLRFWVVPHVLRASMLHISAVSHVVHASMLLRGGALILFGLFLGLSGFWGF